jgi:hypothetical protein
MGSASNDLIKKILSETYRDGLDGFGSSGLHS